MFYNDLILTQIVSVNRQNIFEGRTKLFTVLCGPRKGFTKIILELEQWTTGGSTKRMWIRESQFSLEKDDRQWNNDSSTAWKVGSELK
jgi:hypothetical protein